MDGLNMELIIGYINELKPNKCFIYKDKEYPFNFSLIKKTSEYIKRNKNDFKNLQKIQLINDEKKDVRINIPEDAINIFIEGCSLRNIQDMLNSNNVIYINYLSTIYEVRKLRDITDEYMQRNFDPKLILTKYALNYSNNFFEKQKYEEIISSNLDDLIDEPELLNIDIPSIYNILTRYKNNSKQQNEEKIINFLFKCLDKNGIKASVLFSNIDFSNYTQYLNHLIKNYESKFDFHFLNPSIIKAAYIAENEIIKILWQMKSEIDEHNKELLIKIQDDYDKIKSQFASQMEKMKSEYEENQKDSIAQMKNDFEQLKSKFIKEQQEIFNKMKTENEKMKLEYDRQQNIINDIKSKLEKEKESSSKMKTEYEIMKLEYNKLNESINKLKSEYDQFKQQVSNDHPKIYLAQLKSDLMIQVMSECNKQQKSLNDVKNELIESINQLKEKLIKEIKSKIKIEDYIIKKFVDEKDDYNKKEIAKINQINKIITRFVTSISIPDDISILYDHSFYNCHKLTEIIIPPSVKIIEDFAFGGCSSLFNLNIPSSIVEIGKAAFVDCKSIKNITVPSSVKKIGEGCFNGCTSMVNISLSSSISIIEGYLFNNCTSLTQISIPSSCKQIDHYAFYHCISLKNVTISSTLKSIGNNAFDECTALDEIIIHSSTILYENAFLSKTKVRRS